MKTNYFTSIENLIGVDVGCRGLGKNLQTGDFQEAVEELYQATTVMVVTGFCIKDAMIGETDGPIGAVSLVNGLLKIGKEVIVVTDEYSKELIIACCRILNIDIKIEIVPYADAEAFCCRIIDKYKPSHVVALERPGRAKNGKCYSMRGEDLSDIIPNTDSLFWEAEKKGMKTIAIGDGGNEMGMGKITPFIIENVKYGEKICAETVADNLIIAGVSNWGGHGIVAALSILTSEVLLHGTEEEIKMLQEMVEVGAVDGCSKKPECTVDGLSLEENLSILVKLHEIIIEHIQNG